MPPKRIYVHVDGVPGPEFTLLYKQAGGNDGVTVDELAQHFARAYNYAAAGSPGGPGCDAACSVLGTGSDLDLHLDGRTGRPLPPTARVWDVARDKADVYVRQRPVEARPPSSAPPPLQDGPAVRAMLTSAAAALSAKRYAYATALYGQVLQVSPTHSGALLAIGWMRLVVGDAVAAVVHLRAAVAAAPHDPQPRMRLGEALLAAGHVAEALAAYDAATATFAALPSPDHPPQSPPPPVSVPSLDADEAILGAARCNYRAGGGREHAAAAAVMSILSRDASHPGALRDYLAIALDRGLHDDACRVALRLLAASPTDGTVRAALGRAASSPSGLLSLLTELGPAASSAPALAFVASAVKDHGGCHSAVSLLDRACGLDPRSPAPALALLHAREVTTDLGAGVAGAAAFLRDAASAGGAAAGAAPPWVATVLTAASLGVAAAVHGLPDDATSWPECDASWSPPPRGDGDDDACVASLSRVTLGDVSPTADYTPAQLELCALLFTVAKLLFAGGALARCAAACASIAPTKSASRSPLHATLVRNEAAYYGCVSQLLREHPLPPHAPAGRPLFVLGDSHCLSPAWRSVVLRGETRRCVPVLVTGLKAWHLRPGCTFYPTSQFEASASALPRGAQVISLVGEIDCREGLLIAVERGHYRTVAEGIAVVIGHYLAALQSRIHSNHWEVFVHPVPPVLTETRPIVRLFNTMLSAAVAAAPAATSMPPRLHWLDFVDDLLIPAPPETAVSPATAAAAAAAGVPTHPLMLLRPEMVLDGTHLSPEYVTACLAPCLGKIV